MRASSEAGDVEVQVIEAYIQYTLERLDVVGEGFEGFFHFVEVILEEIQAVGVCGEMLKMLISIFGCTSSRWRQARVPLPLSVPLRGSMWLILLHAWVANTQDCAVRKSVSSCWGRPSACPQIV